MKRAVAGLVVFWGMIGLACSAEVTVAVATNFTQPMQKIAAAFEQDTGHKARLIFGSTGNFYFQIKSGAPFHVLLAADSDTPARLEQEGDGIAATRFTYAVGKLVLWSRQAGLVDGAGEVLKSGSFDHIALANPKLAPYGAAAVETLKNLGLLQSLTPKFVVGENISQTYQFVATGNAKIGFVALSQVWAEGRITQGSAWVVPAHLYPTIRQDAIQLTKAKDHVAASALIVYLRGDRARGIIRSFGYGL